MSVAQTKFNILVVSDSAGETAELVTKAAASQFNLSQLHLMRFPYVNDIASIDDVLRKARDDQAMIVFTIVIPELRSYMIEQTGKLNIQAIDVMGPMLGGLGQLFKQPPTLRPGIVHRLDEAYYRRIEAIEFAVKCDDGRDPRGILSADIILVGVSRTSKTPLSMYLAHKQVKVANVPLIPEVGLPQELLQINPQKCIGLTINPHKLYDIRSERLKSLGLKAQANYAKMERIHTELEYAHRVMNRIGSRQIDVTYRAVEETADLILSIFQKRRNEPSHQE